MLSAATKARKKMHGVHEPKQSDSAGPEEGIYDSSWGHRLTMFLTVLLPFAGLVAGIVYAWIDGWMDWPFLVMLIGGWIMTGLGITVGFHRLLTHNSFSTFSWLRTLWMACGALAVQGSPLVWCAVHRRHHEKSDEHGDPHSPNLHGQTWFGAIKGLVHAHTGWLFTKYWTSLDLKRYVPDLLSDRILVSVDRLYYLWVAASLAIPAALGALITWSWQGALMGFIWGGLARVFVSHHVTWSINSICHVFGKRHFQTPDKSRNNPICGILAFGEGWHNNHHAFPTSARHGLLWWQFDSSWILIVTMKKMGLAWDVVVPSESLMQRKRIQ